MIEAAFARAQNIVEYPLRSARAVIVCSPLPVNKRCRDSGTEADPKQ
jgi:hypothetical protein